MRGAALSLVLCSNLAWAAQPPNFCGISQWQSFIDEAASRSRSPSPWIGAVILAESAGCESMNGRPTTSAAGAMGLMQLMPTTWERLRERLNLGTDPYDPHDNILAGAAYLHELHDRYGWPGASAAYHAGPARYDDYLKSGRPLPGATLEYLARVGRSLARVNADSRLPTVADGNSPDTNRELFVARKASVAVTDTHSDRAATGDLFLALRHDKRRSDSKPPESRDVQQQ